MHDESGKLGAKDIGHLGWAGCVGQGKIGKKEEGPPNHLKNPGDGESEFCE